MPSTDPNAIRRCMRARRRALAAEQHRRAALGVARLLAGSALLRNSRRIACYFPCDGELDLTPVMQRIWAMGKRCYLPVLNGVGTDRLWFACYRPGDPLRLNRFGIPEPHRPHHWLAKPWQLDLILAPLVAFDLRGNRLGMGGGYYDRTLAYLRQRHHWRKPRFYGVAYDFQRVAALTPRPWDVSLDGVITERQLYRTTP